MEHAQVTTPRHDIQVWHAAVQGEQGMKMNSFTSKQAALRPTASLLERGVTGRKLPTRN